MAGIDFEPNHPCERLVNCVMRNCVTENNAGDGYEFYLKSLNDESAPISIRVENCRSVGDRASVYFVTGNGPTRPAVKGTMDFVNCQFLDGEHAGINIWEKPTKGAKVRFVNCEIVNPAPHQQAAAPIMFSSAAGNAENVGGVEFVDCLLKDSVDRQPMNYIDLGGGLRLMSITGKLTVERVKASLLDPTGKLIDEQDNITQAHQFVGERADASKGEIRKGRSGACVLAARQRACWRTSTFSSRGFRRSWRHAKRRCWDRNDHGKRRAGIRLIVSRT